MSVEVTNETVWQIDGKVFSDLGIWVMDQMRVSTQSELRPGDGRTVMEGVLGDIVICPWVAAQQALAAGHSTMEEMMLLTIHGILHLLGYDHATPEQERQMFGLQRQLLLTFFALRQGSGAQAILPSGAPDALAEWDREHGTGRQIAK